MSLENRMNLAYLEFIGMVLLVLLYTVWIVAGTLLTFRIKRLEEFLFEQKEWWEGDPKIIVVGSGISDMKRMRNLTFLLGSSGLLFMALFDSFDLSPFWTILAVLLVFFMAMLYYDMSPRDAGVRKA